MFITKNFSKVVLFRPMSPMKAASVPQSSSVAAKKSKKVYGRASELPQGEILNGFAKKQWKLGKAFASGGFGSIYTATQVGGDGSTFVVKVEPADNGPLFLETHVYQRIAKVELIEAWRKQFGLKYLGIPPYISSGTHEKAGVKFRFLILPRYSTDLDKIRIQKGGKLDEATVFTLTLNVLNVLEYIHSHQYVHADIKAENLLLKDASDICTAYLVDYGLARKLANTLQYKEQKNKAHDGTLVFTSLDAHRGCIPAYRGDIEILLYNVLYWLTGNLPWYKFENEPNKVLAEKERLFANVDNYLRTNCPEIMKISCSAELVKLLKYCASLLYEKKPDYNYLRTTLQQAISKARASSARSSHQPVDSPLPRPSTSKQPKREYVKCDSDSGSELSVSNSALSKGKTKAKRPSLEIVEHSDDSDTSYAKSALEVRKIPGLANMKSRREAVGAVSPTVIQKQDGTVVKIPIKVKPRRSLEASLVNKYLRRKSSVNLVTKITDKKPVRSARMTSSRKPKNDVQLMDSETQTSPPYMSKKQFK